MTLTASQARTIGGYQIHSVLGKGASSTVYLGRIPTSGQEVAIKVVPVNDPKLRTRFAKECQVARRLNHPNVVRVLDFGLDGYTPFLVMEYLGGGSLGDRLERQGRLREAEAVEIITQAGAALHWAHGRRLVHRNVKPDNILLGVDGTAKLADLGMVKILDDDTILTRAADYLGTPNFMSPEQFEDARHVDARSDLYSLAATLYMAVTGELPFRGRNSRDIGGVLRKKLNGDITPPRELVPQVSQRLSDAILKGLEVDKIKRHASVREFIESLTADQVVVCGSKSSVPRVSERRAGKRFSSDKSTICNKLQEPTKRAWAGKVVDVSQTGVCLELARRVERGVLLAVIFEAGPLREHTLIASVKWVKQAAGKRWRLGCCFTQPLTDEEVQSMRELGS
jgi:serine/threonine protein kinase